MGTSHGLCFSREHTFRHPIPPYKAERLDEAQVKRFERQVERVLSRWK